MEYDLLQKYRDINAELFINRHITADDYFEQDILNDYLKELFIINLN